MSYDIFPVLRNAIWGTNQEILNSSISWKDILKIAEEQTVLGLVFSSIENANNLKIEQQQIYNLISLIEQIKNANRIVNDALLELVRHLKLQNVQFAIVKGQIAGECYPHPFLRQPGDVDLYVKMGSYDICKSIIIKKLQCQINRGHSDKHVDFEWRNVNFELHKRLASFAVKKNQEYFDRLVEKDNFSNYNLEGIDVTSLSPTLNALYIFVHLFLHLIDTGVGLRQFCDWMMWLNRYKDDINKDELTKNLQNLGLIKSYRVLGAILVDNLGLREKDFPLIICDNDRKRSRRIVKDVLSLGNFGFNKEKVHNIGFIHSVHTCFRMFVQEMKYIDLCPKEILCRIPHAFYEYAKRYKYFSY